MIINYKFVRCDGTENGRHGDYRYCRLNKRIRLRLKAVERHSILFEPSRSDNNGGFKHFKAIDKALLIYLWI